jgi:hypothetical protein
MPFNPLLVSLPLDSPIECLDVSDKSHIDLIPIELYDNEFLHIVGSTIFLAKIDWCAGK